MARLIAVADAETDPFKKGRTEIRPFLWGFYDGTTYEEFEKTIDFIQYVYDKNIILYAHNGGKFDWHFIKDYIDPFSEVMIINGRLSRFKIGECEFRDSYNILPTSLATYQKTEISYDIFEKEERHKPHNWKRIRNYLYDDCVDLYNYVTGFIDRFGNHLTQAGAAMKQWETISERTPPKDEGGFNYNMFKHYYYGGRCQSFEFGVVDEEFEMVDINSAYPYAMLSEHPISLDFETLDAEEWYDLGTKEKGATLVTIKGISKGALPFRGKDGGLYFPDDNIERTYHCTGWEILAANDTASLTIKEFVTAYQFSELTDFKEYILHFYEERKKAKESGDKMGDIFCKLLMNSLYGKFGSNPLNYSNYQVVPPDVIDKNGTVSGQNKYGNDATWHYAGEFGEQTLISMPLDEIEQNFYNIATAASITGYVRAYLWRAIKECEGVIYCDTDSIAARKVNNLPNGYGKELGQWGVDGEFVSAALAGKKLYAMEYSPAYKKEHDTGTHKTASKGVRLNAKEIYKIAKGGEVVFEPESPTFSLHKKPSIISRRIKMNKKVLQND